jgi:transposase-like protein
VGTGAPSYKGFRFPVEIISHCVWLYYRLPAQLPEVEEMMLERVVTVSHETIVPVDREVRPGLRQRVAPPPATPRRQVAP